MQAGGNIGIYEILEFLEEKGCCVFRALGLYLSLVSEIRGGSAVGRREARRASLCSCLIPRCLGLKSRCSWGMKLLPRETVKESGCACLCARVHACVCVHV
jgi:hypothetical protein